MSIILSLLTCATMCVVIQLSLFITAEGMININELDPIRRYLPAAERPRPNSRYSSFQVGYYILHCKYYDLEFYSGELFIAMK